MRTLLRSLLVSLSVAAAACATPPVNPSFPLEWAEADEVLETMRQAPKPLERPVVILGGYLDPGLGAWWLGRRIRDVTGDSRVLKITFLWNCSFDECRTRVIRKLDEAFPSDDPIWTTEVDVIGLSMGGLVARDAAAPPDLRASTRRRLKIARLFTISSPHRGASLASLPAPHSLHTDMRIGSPWMREITKSYRTADYELYCYVGSNDVIVGAENAAPPGETPWWLAYGPLTPAHVWAARDPRIHADIARRLRGETPFATRPPAALPGDEKES